METFEGIESFISETLNFIKRNEQSIKGDYEARKLEIGSSVSALQEEGGKGVQES